MSASEGGSYDLLLERMAVHLWTANPSGDDPTRGPWDALTEALRQDWRDLAREAIGFLVAKGSPS